MKKITGCPCDDQSTACDRFALDGREMNLKPMHRISKQHSLEIHRSSVTNFPFVLSSTLSWARLKFKLFFCFFSWADKEYLPCCKIEQTVNFWREAFWKRDTIKFLTWSPPIHHVSFLHLVDSCMVTDTTAGTHIIVISVSQKGQTGDWCRRDDRAKDSHNTCQRNSYYPYCVRTQRLLLVRTT